MVTDNAINLFINVKFKSCNLDTKIAFLQGLSIHP